MAYLFQSFLKYIFDIARGRPFIGFMSLQQVNFQLFFKIGIWKSGFDGVTRHDGNLTSDMNLILK